MSARARILFVPLAAAVAQVAVATPVTEFPICTAPEVQNYPAVSGDVVVWDDQRNSSISGTDIYCYHLAAGQESPLCTASGDQQEPDVSGAIVVWGDRRDGVSFDIYGYELLIGHEFVICSAAGDQIRPAISGDIVVWGDERNPATGPDIYGFNVAEGGEFPICTEADWQGWVAISGGVVVWTDGRNVDSTQADIYGYDLVTKQELVICTAPGDQYGPAISGDIVVWQDARDYETSGYDVYGYDLSSETEFPVCTAPADQGDVAVCGDIVVWVDTRNFATSYTDLYGRDLSAGDEFPICTAAHYQDWPAMSGDTVVWMDLRNASASSADIYGCTLSAPNQPPTCSFTWSQQPPYENQTIVFDGTASTDPDGVIVSWEWDFGDGDTGTGSETSHVYAETGTYLVALTVADDGGASATCTQDVTVMTRVCLTLAGDCWHLLTVPCQPVDADAWEVFDELRPPAKPLDLLSGVLYRYDETARGYVMYQHSVPEEFGAITPGEGYWLWLFDDETICYTIACPGQPGDVYFADPGWHLAGWPRLDDVPWDATLWYHAAAGPHPFAAVTQPGDLLWVMDPVYAWSPATGGYLPCGLDPEEDHLLCALHGYWIYTFVDDVRLEGPSP